MGDDDVDESEDRRQLRRGQRDVNNQMQDQYEELCQPGSEVYGTW